MGKKFYDEIALDENSFGAKRIKGKRGRGVVGRLSVFGLLESQKRECNPLIWKIFKTY